MLITNGGLSQKLLLSTKITIRHQTTMFISITFTCRIYLDPWTDHSSSDESHTSGCPEPKLSFFPEGGIDNLILSTNWDLIHSLACTFKSDNP